MLLVLVSLLVLPKFKKTECKTCIFIFEELENNLHPALLRRLLRFIENHVLKNSCKLFITTHSSVVLDCLGASEQAQFIHLTNNGKSSCSSTISGYMHKLRVNGELGVRASDILQSNAVVWVEGPSDAVYINAWINLYSNGRIKEGRDYICAFFGGSLLARMQVSDPSDQEKHMLNMLLINTNMALICDSDRMDGGDALKARVARVSQEVANHGGHVWITAGKEIENYLSKSGLARVYVDSVVNRGPEPFERFFPSESKAVTTSYAEDVLGVKSVDKVELAIAYCSEISSAELDVLDLRDQLIRLVGKIDTWNK